MLARAARQFVCKYLKKITIKFVENVEHPILVPHLEHVVLDGADDDKDEESAKAELTHTSLSVPRHLGWSQYARVDSLVEEIVLREDEQDDQRHVDVVIAAARRPIERLEDRDDQAVYVSGSQNIVVEPFVLVQQQVQ